MKNETAFSVKDIISFKAKMLNWANRFNIFVLLDNHSYQFEVPAFECLLAVGCKRSFSFGSDNSFSGLQKFHEQKPGWLFGHLGYNAGNIAYGSRRKNEIDFGDGFFFEPEIIVRTTGTEVHIFSNEANHSDVFRDINSSISSEKKPQSIGPVRPLISKEEYINTVKKLQQHIRRGDCYEINFCQQFHSENAAIDPLQIYKRLSEISPNPFGALYKLNDCWCLCASPERFLKKKDNTLISQPIKGTVRRDHADKEKDAAGRKLLLHTQKERIENVMIVDLVRNDLSIVAKEGSVFVKELFGIYSFPQVHQMISTVQAELAGDKKFTDVLRACFPMGSMTGAPKRRVMELIEKYETAERGLFSGSIGYITPEGDFDFNVVIRSIFFDSKKKQLSFCAGSGITWYCDAENEYDECMAKAEAMMKVLETE